MGSIRTRGDTGFLFLDFRYKGIRCREQTALKDTIANRKRVQKMLDRIEAEIQADTFEYQRFFPNSKNAQKFATMPSASQLSVSVDGGAPASTSFDMDVGGVPGTPLLRDFAQTWYQEKEVEWRRSHKRIIRYDIDNQLIPKFGDIEVGRITKADVLAYRAQLAKVNARGKVSTLSNRRLNKLVNLLRQIINEAADRFNFRTPFENIKQLKVKRTDVAPFTLDEVTRILSTVRPDFRNYFTVRFFTGMRTGEIDGLKWKYVDFDRRLILVRETIVLGDEEYTKNDSSQRDIQMSQVVYDALKAQEQGTRKCGDFVFCTRAGTPLDHKNVTTRVWYPLLRHLGLEKRRPYQCRHTAATLWLAAGENPEWIARQMGHTTTEMLFRVYSRFVPNLTRQDGSAFERLLMQSGAVNIAQLASPNPNQGA
ncbi:MAG: Arm DNA-binding domain-containing protein [Burkholderiales bacterium]